MRKLIICCGLVVPLSLSWAEDNTLSKASEAEGPASAEASPKPAKPFPHIGWRNATGDKRLDIGGALRGNYRYEDWQTSSYRNPPHLRFDAFRLDISGQYQKGFTDIGFWFQDKRKYAIDRAVLGYQFTPEASLQLGLPFKPFGLQPYPQFGWSYGIPFYMGYGVNNGAGMDYHFQNNQWTLDAAWFPWATPPELRYAPEVGSYDDVKGTIYGPHHLQYNEKRSQVNIRLARQFNGAGWNNELGGSLAGAQLHNTKTGNNGSYWAAGTHLLLNRGPWHLSGQVIRYAYDPKNPAGADDDAILMGGNGLTPAYLIPAKATTGSLNLARDVDMNWGKLTKLRFYNDYSALWKDKGSWSSSQMNTVGVQVFALPVMLWVDFTWAKNANPWGGAENATGWTSTSSSGSGKWYFRSNINIGYYF
ncbi:hypothetical protein TUM12370_22050 [Salmonella enterica subsp. enterica serovar Choleraesuis]|nr:hypothetical protein TUM12370_22050 [Salmonella enterica subsp. enterica serovar Choleraesuis]